MRAAWRRTGLLAVATVVALLAVTAQAPVTATAAVAVGRGRAHRHGGRLRLRAARGRGGPRQQPLHRGHDLRVRRVVPAAADRAVRRGGRHHARPGGSRRRAIGRGAGARRRPHGRHRLPARRGTRRLHRLVRAGPVGRVRAGRLRRPHGGPSRSTTAAPLAPRATAGPLSDPAGPLRTATVDVDAGHVTEVDVPLVEGGTSTVAVEVDGKGLVAGSDPRSCGAVVQDPRARFGQVDCGNVSAPVVLDNSRTTHRVRFNVPGRGDVVLARGGDPGVRAAPADRRATQPERPGDAGGRGVDRARGGLDGSLRRRPGALSPRLTAPRVGSGSGCRPRRWR